MEEPDLFFKVYSPVAPITLIVSFVTGTHEDGGEIRQLVETDPKVDELFCVL